MIYHLKLRGPNLKSSRFRVETHRKVDTQNVKCEQYKNYDSLRNVRHFRLFILTLKMFRQKTINIFSPFLHPKTHKNAQNKLKLGELRQWKVYFGLKKGKDVI